MIKSKTFFQKFTFLSYEVIAVSFFIYFFHRQFSFKYMYYLDTTCHMSHDHHGFMVIGALGQAHLQFLEYSFFSIYNLCNEYSPNPFLNLFVFHDLFDNLTIHSMNLYLDIIGSLSDFFIRPICYILLYISNSRSSMWNHNLVTNKDTLRIIIIIA